jgi:predicted transposase YbfD/YdcC
MLQRYFETISDPREAWKIDHNLHEILAMTVCAVVSGCEIWEDIVDFCRVKEAWFKGRLGLCLVNGIASHDTFQRVFQLIDPAEFEQCFFNWIGAIAQKTDGEIVSIDGKTLCGSRDAKARAIHMVSAWSNANHLVLGQLKVDEKSNEITAIPLLLDLLDVKGCIVTIDAMGAQKDIAEKIIEKGADYVLALKGNQTSLHEDVALYFEQEKLACGFCTHEKGHGRIEKREYFLETDIDWLSQKPDWKGLRAIGAVRSRVEEKGAVREETRYFITSLTDAEIFAKAVRGHWGVENSLHWVLDVVFREDASRTRKDNSAENFSVVRRIALNLLRGYPANMSLARKRRRCAYDADFMADVLLSAL